MQIADLWLRDIPQQFLCKPKIEVLIRAFARQLQEVEQAFLDIKNKTDLDTAFGKNLDAVVGGIVGLSRKDATAMDVISGGAEMTDERYRQFLKYKILQNTRECTYWDLMDGISMMWDLKRVEYREEIEYPATIIFHGEFDMDEPDAVEFYPELCIRASGVGVILEKVYSTDVLVPIEIGAGLRLYMEFFPRLNLVPLLLDGSWKLDGSRLLSGYRSDVKADLYPVEVGIMPAVAMNVQAEIEHMQVCAEIQQSMDVQAEMGLETAAEEDVVYESGVMIGAGVNVSTGAESGVYTGRLLNGAWKLDGSREMDGGWITL